MGAPTVLRSARQSPTPIAVDAGMSPRSCNLGASRAAIAPRTPWVDPGVVTSPLSPPPDPWLQWESLEPHLGPSGLSALLSRCDRLYNDSGGVLCAAPAESAERPRQTQARSSRRPRAVSSQSRPVTSMDVYWSTESSR